MKEGIRIKNSPFTVLFLFMFAGIQFVAIENISTAFEEDNFKALAGFYYAKVHPTTFFKSFMILLFLGGVFNYLRLFVALFNTDAPFKRKVADFIAICLFVINVLYTSLVVVPLEKSFAILHKGDFKTQIAKELSSELYFVSYITLFIFILMIVFQFVAWNMPHSTGLSKKKEK